MAETISSPGLRVPPGTEELAAGTMLGAWGVVRLLGRGGTGHVYEVESDGVRRAAKVLRRELACDARYVERLRRENLAASRLRHPHIAEVYGCEESDGHVYLLLELVEGPALVQRLDEGPLELGEALEIGRQVASALSAAHEASIVHRDLKPSNIVLTSGTGGPRIKIVDFGICRLADSPELQRLTASGYVVGTPAYMSPEHVEGGSHADARSDVYSLGVLLFEMVIGAPPFTGDPLSILFQQVHKEAPPVRSIAPDVPEEVDALIARTLAKAPADRFQTMKELGAALAYLAVDLGLGPRPAARTQRERKRGAEERGFGAAALAILVLVGIAGAAWYLLGG